MYQGLPSLARSKNGKTGNMEIETGLSVGETCNRNGCNGKIHEHEDDSSCSCHINPPCSHCTSSDERMYCPECGWEGSDEEKTTVDFGEANRKYYEEMSIKWEKERNDFYALYRSAEKAPETKIRKESHTHFSMKVYGAYDPEKTTIDSLMPEIRGTFGGRFKYLDKEVGRFCFIAYTD